MGNRSKKAKSQPRAADLTTLQEQHRNLEAQITAEQNARHPNSLAIRDLKKRKLRVKEQIQVLRRADLADAASSEVPERNGSGDIIDFGRRSQSPSIQVPLGGRQQILATA